MNPLRKYYIKHPKFRTRVDLFFSKLTAFGFIYWIGAAICISSILLPLYLGLPDEIKTPVTTIVGAALSTIVIPMIINRINKKNEQMEKAFERNQTFYTDLTAKIVKVFQETEQYQQRNNIVELANYIMEKYPYICINLSARQMELLGNIKDECHLFFEPQHDAKASTGNIYDYAERFFLECRKQGDIGGAVYLNDRMTEKLEMPALGNMQPSAQIPTTQTGDQNEQRTQTAN